MKDYLISLYIDDELDLDEKIEFVEAVHNDVSLKDEALDLLTQEKRLRSDMVTMMPAANQMVKNVRWKPDLFQFRRPLLAGFALVLLALVALPLLRSAPDSDQQIEQRFVIYQPNAGNMAILGSFTDWNPLPMEKIGTSGYWSISLRLKPGEHHYSYRLEDGLQIADPTVPLREDDDFGGKNSIIKISASI